MVLHPNNDNLIRLRNHRELAGGDPLGGPPINTATVQATITDSDGLPVGGTIPLMYVAGSDGLYEGVASASLNIVDGSQYIVTVRSTDGPDREALWTVRAWGRTRGDV